MSADYAYQGSHKLDGRIGEFRKMLSSGMPVGLIANHFDMTESAVYSFIRRRGLAKPVQIFRPDPAAAVLAEASPLDDGTPGTVTVTVKPNGRASLADIKQAVCQYFRLTQKQIEGNSRARRFAWPRQFAMALSRELTPQSLPAICMRYGGRDHTTCLHSVRAVAQRIKSDSEWAEHYNALKLALTPLPPPANDAEAAE